MFDRLALAAMLSLLSGHVAAQDQGLRWNSMALYEGRSWDPAIHARVNTYLAQIESTGPDGSGYYEIWTDSRPFYQESDADHEALQYRARCNATRSNECLRGQIPAWTERLDTVIYVHGGSQQSP